jgi:hypothetical protein
VLRLGAGAAAATALALSGCSSSRQAGPTTSLPAPVPTTLSIPPATEVDWSALRSALTGRLVQPTDSGYLTDLQLYDSRFDAVHPTTSGLVIDVTPMAAVSVAPGAATIGAGARLVDVYTSLNAAGVSIPATLGRSGGGEPGASKGRSFLVTVPSTSPGLATSSPVPSRKPLRQKDRALGWAIRPERVCSSAQR